MFKTCITWDLRQHTWKIYTLMSVFVIRQFNVFSKACRWGAYNNRRRMYAPKSTAVYRSGNISYRVYYDLQKALLSKKCHEMITFVVLDIKCYCLATASFFRFDNVDSIVPPVQWANDKSFWNLVIFKASFECHFRVFRNFWYYLCLVRPRCS